MTEKFQSAHTSSKHGAAGFRTARHPLTGGHHGLRSVHRLLAQLFRCVAKLDTNLRPKQDGGARVKPERDEV